MKRAVLERQVWLAEPLSAVFPFFAEARNLEEITPPWLRFEVLTPGEVKMKVGALIDYRLRWRGLPIRWRTEITGWDPPHRFVDEQRRGPYRLWVHEHRFEDERGGTRMWDRLEYAVPGGELVRRLFVRRDVDAIFDYRERQMAQLFGREPESRKNI